MIRPDRPASTGPTSNHDGPGMKALWMALGLMVALGCAAPARHTSTGPAMGGPDNPGSRPVTPAPARVTPELTPAQRAEIIRTNCLQGARYICGRVLQIRTNGVVVDSGYTDLMDVHYRQLWRVPGTANVHRDPSAVEINQPGAPCVGLVFLTDLPRRPPLRLYDYVSIHAYPVGSSTYTPVPGVQKTIREFAVRLSMAMHLQLNAPPK